MTADASTQPRGLALLFGWPRVRVTLIAATLIGLLLSIDNDTPTIIVVFRALIVGGFALIAFGVFEQWPRRLPKRIARSALQVIAIAIVIPPGAAIAYGVTRHSPPGVTVDKKKLFAGYASLTFAGILFAPWIAVGAMLKQRDAFAREQALAFELERSQLARSALDAQLRLLQAQVAPHFLFNTLANVQALVDSGSPHASQVLASLIAYLRAAVPRMHSPAATLGQEIELVRAYLELMQMRIPDRLTYSLRIDPAAEQLLCPAMTILTLVENAVRHGIDPQEAGGTIDVAASVRDQRCVICVSDTGAGLQTASKGLGTGLTTLRERLRLTFGNDAQLRLSEIEPHGTRAELSFPAKAAQR